MNHWFFLLCFVLHSEYERKRRQLNFLLENESIFSDALLVTQDVLKRLEECSEIKGAQEEVGPASFICWCSVLWIPDQPSIWGRTMKMQNTSGLNFFKLKFFWHLVSKEPSCNSTRQCAFKSWIPAFNQFWSRMLNWSYHFLLINQG